MIRRLVDASYAMEADQTASPARIAFWLDELRSPEFLRDAVVRFPEVAVASTRPAVQAPLVNGDNEWALDEERRREVELDRAYWAPLRRELEALRHASRKG